MEYTLPKKKLIDGFAKNIGGEMDDVPENAFYKLQISTIDLIGCTWNEGWKNSCKQWRVRIKSIEVKVIKIPWGSPGFFVILDHASGVLRIDLLHNTRADFFSHFSHTVNKTGCEGNGQVICRDGYMLSRFWVKSGITMCVFCSRGLGYNLCVCYSSFVYKSLIVVLCFVLTFFWHIAI